MLNNPLIQRYRYSSFRKRQIWIYATLYVSVIMLLIFINYSIYVTQDVFLSVGAFFQSLYYQFITFQVFILCIWAAYNSSSVIKDEILEKSYDFFRMLPIPALEKAVGIIIGKNLVVLLMAGANFFFVFLFGILGKVNFYLQFQILLGLLSAAFLFNSVGLLSSVCTKPKSKSSNSIALIFVGFFVLPYIFAGVYQMSDADDLQFKCIEFFGFYIPQLILIAGIIMYFACWALKGVVRKFNYEHEPLFTMRGAFLFILGYELIASGLFVTHLFREDFVVYAFWATTLGPVMIVVLGSLKGMQHYIEHSRGLEAKRLENAPMMKSILAQSNLAVCLGLFAIWAIFAVAMVVIAQKNLLVNVHSVLVIFSSYLFVVLLVELYSIYSSSNPKIGLLMGFIIVIFLVLPLVFGGIFDSELIMVFSPFGYFINLLSESEGRTLVGVSIWIVNFLLCIIPAKIVLNNYRLILKTREKMSCLNVVD